MFQSLASQMAPVQPQPPENNLESLAVLWAKKYYQSVSSSAEEQQETQNAVGEANSVEGRKKTSEKLLQKLNLASARAWSLTETLLSDEIRKHGINPDLINPLEIAMDTRHLFHKAFEAYAVGALPQRLSVIVGRDSGKVRKKYTSIDPRAIGFVSMQFHHTGQKILEWLSPEEQKLFIPYLKVMDDHMYMPLQAAYEAAANHAPNSPELGAVQHLLPVSTRIAEKVYTRACRQNPGYQSYSGALKSEVVKISSIRDAEMFQVYLCLCVLESNIQAVQQELFPLCVLLYPRLNVSWTLVQEMLLLMGWEIQERLPLEDTAIFLPYLRTFSEMFSRDVFYDG
jgi:hypothetical protein